MFNKNKGYVAEVRYKMENNLKKNIIVFSLVALFFLIHFTCPASGQTDKEKLDLMLARIEEKSGLKGESAEYLRRLTPLLFDYLKEIAPEEKLEPLYNAQSLEELGLLLETHLKKGLIEFGEKMFTYFQEKAARDSKVETEKWLASTSEHFVFFFHPGSIAEAEIDFIKKGAEHTYSSLTASLEIEENIALSLKILHTVFEKGKEDKTKELFPGKIAVYLHQSRVGGAKEIGENSMGKMAFGATILEQGAEKGWARLTAQVDVLYFNAFSLAVLYHEVAHAVLFLGSFDPAPLGKAPLKGKSDLKKAFFAGYTPISPFLHEGIGDHVLYYKGFYKLWPVLPQIEKMVHNIIASDRYIPLSTLIKEDRLFRVRHHKEYSLEAASFLDFLIQNYGQAQLKRWFLDKKSKETQTFEKIYQMPIREVEKRWHSSIKSKLE